MPIISNLPIGSAGNTDVAASDVAVSTQTAEVLGIEKTDPTVDDALNVLDSALLLESNESAETLYTTPGNLGVVFDSTPRPIHFAQGNGIIVGVGTVYNNLGDANKTYWTSVDGVTWTARTFTNPVTDIVFANGVFVCKMVYRYASAANNYVYVSSDGIDWTEVQAANLPSGSTSTSCYAYPLTYVHDRFIFGIAPNTYYSFDGYIWQTVQLGDNNTYSIPAVIQYNDGEWFVVHSNNSYSYLPYPDVLYGAEFTALTKGGRLTKHRKSHTWEYSSTEKQYVALSVRETAVSEKYLIETCLFSTETHELSYVTWAEKVSSYSDTPADIFLFQGDIYAVLVATHYLYQYVGSGLWQRVELEYPAPLYYSSARTLSDDMVYLAGGTSTGDAKNPIITRNMMSVDCLLRSQYYVSGLTDSYPFVLEDDTVLYPTTQSLLRIHPSRVETQQYQLRSLGPIKSQTPAADLLKSLHSTAAGSYYGTGTTHVVIPIPANAVCLFLHSSEYSTWMWIDMISCSGVGYYGSTNYSTSKTICIYKVDSTLHIVAISVDAAKWFNNVGYAYQYLCM